MRSAFRLKALLAIVGLLLVPPLAQAESRAGFAPLFSAKGATMQDPFTVNALRGDDGGLQLTWTIAPGSYLYRDKIAVRTPQGIDLPISTAKGETKDDVTFGPTQIYRGTTSVRLEEGILPASGTLSLVSQGCSDQGICFPPEYRTLDLVTLAIRSAEAPPPRSAPAAPSPVSPQQPPAEQADTSAAAMLLTGNLALLLGGFFGFGLLMAFTPCIFPMIPILSGMLAAAGERLSPRRGLAVSGVFAMAMAVAYGVLGLVAAASGQNLQVALQTPVVLALMSAVFVALALSMVGVFTLQVPTALATRLSGMTNGRRGGTLAGAAALGFTSALVVGPCVTPPLAAALLYVAQTGDVARGTSALFAMGLGMGLPLVAVSLFGARLMPKAGRWLDQVKHVFAFIFLGLAISMLSRVMSTPATIGLWGLLAVAAGIWFAAFDPEHGRLRWSRPVLAAMAGGGAILAGGALMATAALAVLDRPVSAIASALLPAQQVPDTAFATPVSTMADLDREIAQARLAGRPIVVDFTAEWCVICAELDRDVLRLPDVQKRLRSVAFIRVDVTRSDADSRALMQRFNVMGPPTLFFIDPASGAELPGLRSIGSFTQEDFTQRLARIGA